MPSPHDILHVPSLAAEAQREQLGPYGIECLIPRSAEIEMTAYRVVVQPHSTTAVSFHKLAEELYYVLSGCGTAVLNGNAVELSPGDFLRLPPGTTHGFITRESPLIMLDIHSPGSRPDRDVYFTGDAPPGFSS